MTQYASPNATFKYGSNFMQNYIDSDIEVEKTAETEEATPIGAAVNKEAFSGITTLKDIGVGGIYDDQAATGPDAVFGGGLGTSAAVEILYGGTKKTTVAGMGVKAYKRTISKGKLTRYATTLCNTGATITEA